MVAILQKISSGFSSHLLKFKEDWFGPGMLAGQAEPGPVLHAFNPDPDFKPSLSDVPRYPPFDSGLPFVAIDDLLLSQKNLIGRIHEAELPFADEAVKNLAAYVHLLPATSNDFFCGAGGLFRLCLETGFHSYVAAQGNIFTARDPAEKRRDLEAKWQLAAFLAGLCCELSRAIVTSVVTNDHGQQWLPFEPLTTWLTKTGGHRYFLRSPQSQLLPAHDTAHLSGVIINAIIPNAALQHITTDDRAILMAMLSSITQISATFNAGPFHRTIRHVRDQVIARDQRSNPLTFGRPMVGMHVEPYLINGMRHLVRSGRWKVNQKMARIHLAPDGAFLFWSTGVQEILELLREEGSAVGFPTDPRTLGEWLMGSGVFEENPDGGLWWYVKTPVSASVYEVVKLSSASVIMEDEVLASVAVYEKPIVVASAEERGQSVVVQTAEQEVVLVSTEAAPIPSEDGKGPDEPAPAKPATKVPQGDEHAPDETKLQERQQGSKAKGKPGSGKKNFEQALAIGAGGKAVSTTVREAVQRMEDGQPAVQGAAARDTEPASTDSQVEAPSPKSSATDGSVVAEGAAVGGAPQVKMLVLNEVFKRPSQAKDVQALIDLHNQSIETPMFWVEQGLAIPVRAMEKVCDGPPTVAVLKAAGVLVLTADGGSVHRIQRGPAAVSSVIVEKSAALGLGFVPEKVEAVV